MSGLYEETQVGLRRSDVKFLKGEGTRDTLIKDKRLIRQHFGSVQRYTGRQKRRPP